MQHNEPSNTEPAFLAGGGEMGRLTRAFCWTQTSLGAPEKWPQSLRTTLGLLLRSRFPMFLFWGPQHICFYNDAYRPSLGNEGKHPAALGKPAAEVWPEIWNDIYPQIEAILNGADATWHEDQLLPIYRNGKLEDVYWTYSYSPVIDEGGMPAGVFVTCTETTPTVRLIQDLQAANEKAHLAIEAGDLGVVEVDFRSDEVRISPRMERFFGVANGTTRAEFVSRMHPDDLPEREQAFARAMQTGVLEYDTRVNNGKGAIRWIRARGRVLFDTDGKPLRMVSMVHDVTEQKQFFAELARQVADRTAEIEEAHRELLASHESLQQIINVFTSALQVLEPVWKDGEVVDFRYKLTNEAYSAYANKTPNELQGRLVSEIFPGYFDTDSLRNIREVAQTGVARTWENHYDADGLNIYNEMGAVPMNGDIVVHLTDFTGLKKLQMELERNITELKRSNQNLEEFAHAASHDLKEPIRKIHFFTQQLKDQLCNHLTPAQQSSFERIEKASRRMGMLVDDLLTYSHVTDRPQVQEPVELSEVLARVLEDLELDIQDKQADIHVQPLPVISGYRRQLQQLLQNLVSNSLKYSKKGVPPRIAISASERSEGGIRYQVLRVQDNGIGFDNAYKEKIFHMFARLHGKHEYSGTGVGLSIVKKVVENHRGMIRADGSPDEGAVFEVWLPIP
ncbi:MAG: PAS domain S-box protein [Chitinophagaceae bacterium]|nr:MAG: PAS domain S-box protein [Chitinophagaceae bacterium]